MTSSMDELIRLRAENEALRSRLNLAHQVCAADSSAMSAASNPSAHAGPGHPPSVPLHELRLIQGAKLAGLALAEVDYARGLHHLSAEAAQLFGLGAQSMTVPRTKVHETFHPDDRADIALSIAQALAPDGPGCFVIDHRVVWPLGEVRWVRVRKQIYFSDDEGPRRPLRALLVVFDITAEKQAATAVRTTEELNRNLMESSPDSIKVIDLDGFVLHVNGPGLRLLEMDDPAQICGVKWWELWPAECEGLVRDAVTKATAGESVLFTAPRPTARGTDKWWNISVSPIRDTNTGAVANLLVVSRDVTHARRTEDDLRDANEKKSVFISTLAHELRNPLAPIRNVVSIFRLKEKTDPQLLWGNGVIERQVEHMARLLDELLDLARIATGKITLTRALHDLQSVIEQAIEISQPLIDAGKHALTVDLPDLPLHVDGDLVRLVQLFSNLLNNAAKYTPSGGRIALHVDCDGKSVIVKIADNGIGISNEDLPEIFEAFGQVQSSLERAQGGVGIGLALVRALVELHGGHIQARSDGPGRGSEFVVRLPLASQPEPGDARPAGSTRLPSSGQERRILIADDSRDSADSLAELLRMNGYEVQVAYDGGQALGMAEAFKPHIALLDIGMPELTGYEACRSIRQQPWGKEMMIIAQTGWGQEDDRRRTTKEGFDHHLVKPIDLGLLFNLLEARNF